MKYEGGLCFYEQHAQNVEGRWGTTVRFREAGGAWEHGLLCHLYPVSAIGTWEGKLEDG